MARFAFKTFRRRLRRAWSRYYGFLWGYDIFVSYAHVDERIPREQGYAHKLADSLRNGGKRLRKYSVLLDTIDYTAGSRLRKITTDRIRASSYVVVVVRKGALRSKWVLREVKCAVMFGKGIIAIDVDGSLADSDQHQPLTRMLADRVRIVDRVGEDATPSDAVRHAIERTFGQVRQRSRRAIVIMLTLSALVSLSYWVQTEAAHKRQARQDANTYKENATKSENDADRSRKVASESYTKSFEVLQQDYALLTDPSQFSIVQAPGVEAIRNLNSIYNKLIVEGLISTSSPVDMSKYYAQYMQHINAADGARNPPQPEILIAECSRALDIAETMLRQEPLELWLHYNTAAAAVLLGQAYVEFPDQVGGVLMAHALARMAFNQAIAATRHILHRLAAKPNEQSPPVAEVWRILSIASNDLAISHFGHGDYCAAEAIEKMAIEAADVLLRDDASPAKRTDKAVRMLYLGRSMVMQGRAEGADICENAAKLIDDALKGCDDAQCVVEWSTYWLMAADANARIGRRDRAIEWCDKVQARLGTLPNSSAEGLEQAKQGLRRMRESLQPSTAGPRKR